MFESKDLPQQRLGWNYDEALNFIAGFDWAWIKEHLAKEDEEPKYVYGVVEWVNGNPILDGMPCFDSMEDAIKNVPEPKNYGYLTAKYTIITIERQ